MQARPKEGRREEPANSSNRRLPVVLERLYGGNCTLLPLRQAVLRLAQQASTPRLQGQLLQDGLERPGAVHQENASLELKQFPVASGCNGCCMSAI